MGEDNSNNVPVAFADLSLIAQLSKVQKLRQLAKEKTAVELFDFLTQKEGGENKPEHVLANTSVEGIESTIEILAGHFNSLDGDINSQKRIANNAGLLDAARSWIVMSTRLSDESEREKLSPPEILENQLQKQYWEDSIYLLSIRNPSNEFKPLL